MKILYRILIFFGVLMLVGVVVLVFVGIQIRKNDQFFAHQWGPRVPSESRPELPPQPDLSPNKERSSKPNFSHPHGFYEEPFEVALSSGQENAEIWFTTDHTIPRPATADGGAVGTRYERPLKVDSSTIVTAVAAVPGQQPSLPFTQSYFFIADILSQDRASAVKAGWPARPENGKRMDYGMDPEIVSRFSSAEWKEAFTQISSLSVVTEQGNLTDIRYGIYTNPGGQGKGWERYASFELLDNGGGAGFQVGAGLRIRGGFTRSSHFVKHSFRLFFRKAYGAGKLKFPLFEDEGANRFDKVDLRTAQNYSWARREGRHSGLHNTFVREVFCRDTQRAMGEAYTRSRYYHLFLNGQYWGIYMTEERPEAAYGATYFDGEREEFDTLKCSNFLGGYLLEATDGNTEAWKALWEGARQLAKNPTDDQYAFLTGLEPSLAGPSERGALVDIDNLIVYMLINFYAGNSDGPLSAFLGNERSNNWFALRNRNGKDGFRFFVHDAEHTLGAPQSGNDRTGPFRSRNQNRFQYSNPQWLHQDLCAHHAYRKRFSELAHEHLTGDGALTSARATQRFRRRANQINQAIRAQSARWGDAEYPGQPYLVEDWEKRIEWVIENAIQGREQELIAQLREDGLFID